MNSEIEIVLGGDSFPTLVPISASIQYSLNGIPTATCELDARATVLLCDFEQHRRKLVTLVIRTTKGCLHFDGFIDGCNIQQAAGNLGLQIVIKSRYQWLLETYNRVPGLHPSSLNVFQELPILEADIQPGATNFVSSVKLGEYALAKVNLNTPLFQVIRVIYHEMLDLLASTPRIFSTDISMLPTVAIIKAAEVFLAQKLPLAKAMFSSMNTDAVDGILVSSASSGNLGTDLINAIAQTMRGSLFESLVQVAQQYGCNVVVGNSVMYIVPDIGYLKVPHAGTVGRGLHSRVPNIIYPAEYTSFQFNDQGYRDIKGCYLASLPESMPLVTGGGATSRCLGVFIDPTAIGGILVDHLPQFVSGPLEFLAIKHSEEITAAIKAGLPRTADGVLTVEQVERQDEIIDANIEALTNVFIQKIGDNWAQLTYLQRKFADRTGSINAIFDPTWAPGAVGTMYTRFPGVWIDFRVTGVSHNFSASVGGGTATTSVSFDCGRMGKVTGTGLDTVAFYDYNYAKSAAFAEAFVANTSRA